MPPHSTTRRPPRPEKPSVLHPYCRISDPGQRKGGGLERQTTADLTTFAERYGFAVSKRILIDDGVSAFHGLNATPAHQLGRFLAEATRGLIPPGDCLLLENWDRLSRQDIWAAIGLVNDLRQLGIHVGRLDRMKLLRCDSNDPGDFFEAAIELMRGHSESKAKEDRNGKAWVRKRQAAREGRKLVTRRVPLWIEERGGNLYLIPEKSAVVKRVFTLAAAGYGYCAICRKLNDDGVPPFGDFEEYLDERDPDNPRVRRRAKKGGRLGGGRWGIHYLARLLNDRRVLGEYQPRTRGRKPAGPPIPGYYPSAVTKEEYDAAQGAADCRRKKGSGGKERKARRIGKHINLFAGLVKNARDGDDYIAATKPVRVLVNARSQAGGGRAYSFPLPVFETAVLGCLREIKPHDILNGDSGPDESLVLAGQLAAVEAELAVIDADVAANGYNPAAGRRSADLEACKADLTAQLALARQEALHPLSETWGEVQTLAEALATAPDPADARIRLRAKLRRIVSGAWLLIVSRGRDRLAAVQIDFAKGRRRTYLIHYRQAGYRRSGFWQVLSSTLPWQRAVYLPKEPPDLSTRQGAEDAETFLKGLSAADVEDLFNGCERHPLP
jgi:hypothetical protein